MVRCGGEKMLANLCCDLCCAGGKFRCGQEAESGPVWGRGALVASTAGSGHGPPTARRAARAGTGIHRCPPSFFLFSVTVAMLIRFKDQIILVHKRDELGFASFVQFFAAIVDGSNCQSFTLT